MVLQPSAPGYHPVLYREDLPEIFKIVHIWARIAVMSEALKNTSWPSTAISADARSLIDQFFTLVDDKSEYAGTELATKVFTENGTMITAAGTFKSSTGKKLLSVSPCDIANASQKSLNQENTPGT